MNTAHEKQRREDMSGPDVFLDRSTARCVEGVANWIAQAPDAGAAGDRLRQLSESVENDRAMLSLMRTTGTFVPDSVAHQIGRPTLSRILRSLLRAVMTAISDSVTRQIRRPQVFRQVLFTAVISDLQTRSIRFELRTDTPVSGVNTKL